jgi:hypothetical protein
METLTQVSLTQLEQYIKKYYHKVRGNHFITLVDIIYMAALREKIEITDLLRDLTNGILNIDACNINNSGNIYDFIDSRYISFANRIKDITVGSNGGMANVGKGEWLLSLCSGINQETNTPNVTIIKNGLGDIQYNGTTQEVKWNGGKVSVEKPGKEITSKFNTLIDIPDKKWVPFRKGDKSKYSEEQIQKYNAIYWQAISGEENKLLSDNDLKYNITIMSFEKVFEKSDSFIMFNNDGSYQRFCNIEDVQLYYKDKIHLINFECRASQSNPIAMYCQVY